MTRNAAGTARSAALIVALAIGGLILLGAAITAVPRITGYFTDYWNGRAGLLTGRRPQVPGVDRPEFGGLDYGGVLIVSDRDLLAPRALQAVAEGLGILVIVAGGLLVVLLAVRMLKGRSFARLLSWGLGGLGALVIVAATVAPQLEALAVTLAVRDLGYAVYGAGDSGILTPDGPEAIELPLWGWLWVLDRVDPTLLLLGILILVLGVLVADGTRLQRDTEGLV